VSLSARTSIQAAAALQALITRRGRDGESMGPGFSATASGSSIRVPVSTPCGLADRCPTIFARSGWPLLGGPLGGHCSSNFGDTFSSSRAAQEELLLGAGCSGRLIRQDVLLELDFTASALGRDPRGSAHSRFTTSSGSGPAHELRRVHSRHRLRGGCSHGLECGRCPGREAGTTSLSNLRTLRERSPGSSILGFEVEGSFCPQWSVVGRIHIASSGAFGTFNGGSEAAMPIFWAALPLLAKMHPESALGRRQRQCAAKGLHESPGGSPGAAALAAEA